MTEPLGEDEISGAIAGNGFERDGDAIARDFELDDFVTAVAFVNDVAVAAEEANHHPDIELRDYNHVRIRLSTHSAGGVTDKDLALATAIARISDAY